MGGRQSKSSQSPPDPDPAAAQKIIATYSAAGNAELLAAAATQSDDDNVESAFAFTGKESEEDVVSWLRVATATSRARRSCRWVVLTTLFSKQQSAGERAVPVPCQKARAGRREEGQRLNGCAECGVRSVSACRTSHTLCPLCHRPKM